MEKSYKFDLETLKQVQLSAITRKVMRSKKLTRLFIHPRRTRFKLVSILDLPPRSKGAEIQIRPSEPLRAQAPAFLAFDDEAAEANRIKAPEVFPPIKVRKIRDAVVFGGSNRFIVGANLIHHRFFELQSDITLEERNRLLQLSCDDRTALKFIKDPKPFSLKVAANFTDAASFNYAHWMTEVLVRIHLFQTHPASENVPLIIDHDLHENMLRSLEAVIRPHTKVYTLPRNREIKVASLFNVDAAGYIPIEPRDELESSLSHGIFSHAALAQMVHSIKKRLGLTGSHSPRRKIYIKRNSTYRNLANAEQLEQMLRASGFETIEPEKLSFEEQVEIFHSASTILGATGAAMANLMFCPSDCKIFILISKHAGMPYGYWQNIANSTGQQVNYILCTISDNEHKGIHADYLAPLQTVQEAVGLLASEAA